MAVEAIRTAPELFLIERDSRTPGRLYVQIKPEHRGGVHKFFFGMHLDKEAVWLASVSV